MRDSSRSLLAYIFTLFMIAGCGSSDSENPAVTASIGQDTDAENNGEGDGGIKTPDKLLQDPNFPRVKIVTSLGEIVVELNAQQAPITVKNFLWYANNGHYEGTVFHQVMRDYMVLGGGYSEAFEEKPTQFWIRNEADNGLKNVRGAIAMARRPDQVDSSTCQFFFNLADNPHLNHKNRKSARDFGYCVFGRVVEGIEVLDQIGAVSVIDNETFVSVPKPPVVIKSVAQVF